MSKMSGCIPCIDVLRTHHGAVYARVPVFGLVGAAGLLARALRSHRAVFMLQVILSPFVHVRRSSVRDTIEL
jgi:hypothetical protein